MKLELNAEIVRLAAEDSKWLREAIEEELEKTRAELRAEGYTPEDERWEERCDDAEWWFIHDFGHPCGDNDIGGYASDLVEAVNYYELDCYPNAPTLEGFMDEAKHLCHSRTLEVLTAHFGQVFVTE